MRPAPELLLAAGDSAAAEVAGSCAVGWAAAVSCGLRLGRLMLGTLALGATLLMALLTAPPHPVTSKPAARAAARGTTHLAQRRGPRPRGGRTARNAPASTAQASPGRGRRASPPAGDLCRAQGRPSSGSRSASPVKDAVTTYSGRRTSIWASRANVSRSALVSGGWVTERGHSRYRSTTLISAASKVSWEPRYSQDSRVMTIAKTP